MRLHAAGSLKPALTELARNFTEATGVKVEATFGASGLLRERLEKGEPGDVFASADIGNPLALSRAHQQAAQRGEHEHVQSPSRGSDHARAALTLRPRAPRAKRSSAIASLHARTRVSRERTS